MLIAYVSIVMRACIRITLLVLLGITGSAVFVAEGALHIWKRDRPDDPQAARIARIDDAAWRSVQVRASDGATLDGWLFTPRQPNGAGVIALHSVGDVISYGVREAGDIRQWESLLLATPGVERIYGIGQSMGAAILIESLAH